jgi:hypothetical protein
MTKTTFVVATEEYHRIRSAKPTSFSEHATVSLRLAALAFAPFRASQSPWRKNTKSITVHLVLFLSRPAH